MKEITSYQIDLSKELNTQKITSLYHYVSFSDHDVYLYQNGQIADAGNFPKLVSFFLLTDIKAPLVVIIDGPETQETFQDIRLLLNQHVKRTIIRKTHLAKEGISVVV